jgi:hypothetical protein
MSATLIDTSATVLCAHGSPAQASQPSARVQAAGAPIVTISSPFSISGCPNMNGNVKFPCVTALFSSGATRVMSMNQPVLLKDGTATATPTGTPLNVVNTQQRVKGQ